MVRCHPAIFLVLVSDVTALTVYYRLQKEVFLIYKLKLVLYVFVLVLNILIFVYQFRCFSFIEVELVVFEVEE